MQDSLLQPAVNEHGNTEMEQSASCKFVCCMRHVTVTQFAKVHIRVEGIRHALAKNWSRFGV